MKGERAGTGGEKGDICRRARSFIIRHPVARDARSTRGIKINVN